MANSKDNLTPEQQAQVDEMIAQAVAKENKKLELKQQQRQTNTVSLGAIVQEKRVQIGSPIIDKETKQQKIDSNGIPQSYPDTHYVTIQSMGVEFETKVTKEQFENLEEFKYYLCEGRVSKIRKFGNELIEPVFNTFTLI